MDEVKTTAQEILSCAEVKYPSWVRGGDWYDVSPPVRVVCSKTGDQKAVFLVDAVLDRGVFVGETEPASLEGYVLSKIRGAITPDELTPRLLGTLSTFLNVIADERIILPDEGGAMQTERAVAARTLLDAFFLKREKGLLLP